MIADVIERVMADPIYVPFKVAQIVPWAIPDGLYLKLYYRYVLKRWPNLESPQTFTEKLQWLKLHDHNPLYTKLVDKVVVKEHVRHVLGEGYCFRTLGVWDDARDIDFTKLPDKFVLKCNHFGGGAVFICKDRQKFDISEVQRKLNRQLHKSMYLQTREWPYRNVRRKVFAEEYMEDEFGELRDYKFYCINGEPKMVVVVTDRFDGHYFTNFDADFNELEEVHRGSSKSPTVISRPENFEEMKTVARKLASGLRFVRIDLYNVKSRIYFGEYTFYPVSGHDDQSSEAWDICFGKLLDIGGFQ